MWKLDRKRVELNEMMAGLENRGKFWILIWDVDWFECVFGDVSIN